MPTARFLGACFVLVGASIAALLPVFIVLYPAAGIGQADAGNPAVLLPAIARSPALFVGPGLVELAAHALGAVAVAGLWWRWGGRSFLVTAATLGGVLWMGVDSIDNAIAIQVVPALAASYAAGSSAAAGDFRIVSVLTDALRLAGHFGGGLWIVGLSAFAIRSGTTNRVVAWAGIATGLVLAANPIVPALLNVSFLTLPLWLIAFGITLARQNAGPDAMLMVEATPA